MTYSTPFYFVVESKLGTAATLRMSYNGPEFVLATIGISTTDNPNYPNSAIGVSTTWIMTTEPSSGTAYFNITHWDGSGQYITITVTN